MLRAVLTEAVQFVPVLALAAGFVLSGEIDLAVAGPRFAIAAALAVFIVGGLAWKRTPLNPFLLGADLWLLVGALVFNVPIPPVADLLARLGGGGLFVGALLAGTSYTIRSPRGYLGVIVPQTRALSIVLVILTAAAVIWASRRPEDVRLGSALPFIGINVLRRVMGRVASRRAAAR